MLEELFNLVKGVAGDAVINNPDVPNEHNNEVNAFVFFLKSNQDDILSWDNFDSSAD